MYVCMYVPFDWLDTYMHHLDHPGRLALRLEHVDHDAVVDVVACVRVDLGHVRACVTSSSS